MKKPGLKLKKPQLKWPKLSLKRSAGRKPSIKPPKFAADLYADLRDRRLLPLVALLLVAIVAAPILLASEGDDETPAPVSAPPPATASVSPASFTVVPETLELRDPKKRLDHREARNPFRQPVPESTESDCDCDATGTSSQADATAGATTGATEYATAEPPTVKATVKATVDFAAVLKTQFVGEDPKEQRLEAQTKLPNPQNPAIVYTGISPDKTAGMFLMTNAVTAFYGHGQCVLGGAVCQQIKLKIGKSATFAIGYGETRYKVTLRGFVPIVKEAKVERGG